MIEAPGQSPIDGLSIFFASLLNEARWMNHTAKPIQRKATSCISWKDTMKTPKSPGEQVPSELRQKGK